MVEQEHEIDSSVFGTNCLPLRHFGFVSDFVKSKKKIIENGCCVGPTILTWILYQDVRVNFVLRTSKKFMHSLGKNHYWELHFEMKCADLRPPLALFRLKHFVECE